MSKQVSQTVNASDRVSQSVSKSVKSVRQATSQAVSTHRPTCAASTYFLLADFYFLLASTTAYFLLGTDYLRSLGTQRALHQQVLRGLLP